jgi:hypothetical protein
MVVSRRRIPPVLVARACVVCAAFAVLQLAALLIPGAARAGTPATVTFRAVGKGPQYETLVPPTQVTTTTALVKKNGGSCSGTSAAGALELGTAGDWNGEWNIKYSDYEVTSIEGTGFPFEEGASANYYWSFWLNSKEATVGVCEAELNPGDQVLFFPACYGPACPPAPSVLSIEAPLVAEVGKPVTIAVMSHPSTGGEPTPMAGAVVTGGGASSSPTGADGKTTMTFSKAEQFNLYATGSGEPSVPAEVAICVHASGEAGCGVPGGSTGSSAGPSSTGVPVSAPYTGPYALVPKLASLIDGHVYPRGHAPRVLSGSVLAHATVSSVSLTLRREYRGRCYAFDGISTRFVRARCGTGSSFKVASNGTFSYLLPEILPPGRYVLDVEATDTAGNRTTLARGSSRIVFYVR